MQALRGCLSENLDDMHPHAFISQQKIAHANDRRRQRARSFFPRTAVL